MLLLLAPFLTLIAVLGGAIASVVAIVLNGPRRLRERGQHPLVVLPPVPTPEMRRMLEERRAELA